jgi:chloramphenicol-sensitive protein RarD
MATGASTEVASVSVAPLTPAAVTATLRPDAVGGVLYGVAAYSWWGLVAIYFKAVKHVPAMEVLAHRVIWSTLLLVVLMRAFRRWPAALAAVREPQVLKTLVGSTTLIALNWLLYIWAVANDRVLEGSLGYFINPLVNVLLGFLFLHERLRSWQYVSIGLAAVGVIYMTLSYGTVPWVALSLATTFAFYGLLRKIARVDSLVGLTLETCLLTPLMLGYLVVLFAQGRSAFGTTFSTTVLLLLAGAVTAIPLLWFASAARRLRLATLGQLQYIAPTGQFLLAVAVFGESFTRVHAFSFACIWIGLLIYTADSIRAGRK